MYNELEGTVPPYSKYISSKSHKTPSIKYFEWEECVAKIYFSQSSTFEIFPFIFLY